MNIWCMCYHLYMHIAKCDGSYQPQDVCVPIWSFYWRHKCFWTRTVGRSHPAPPLCAGMHAHTYMHTRRYMHTYTRVHKDVNIHTYTHKHTHKVYTDSLWHTFSYTHKQIHTHNHKCGHIYSHMHIHMHTFSQIPPPFPWPLKSPYISPPLLCPRLSLSYPSRSIAPILSCTFLIFHPFPLSCWHTPRLSFLHTWNFVWVCMHVCLCVWFLCTCAFVYMCIVRV